MSRKLRVLIVKERLDPYSGFSRHILEVSRRLADRYGLRFMILTSEVRATPPEPWPDGIEVYTLGGRPFTFVRTRSRIIYKILKQFRPDLLDVHGGPGVALTLPKEAFGLPLVVSLHASQLSWRDFRYVRLRDFRDEPKLRSLGVWVNLALPLRALAWCLRAYGVQAVAVPTREQQRALQPWLGRSVFYIPSGIDPQMFKSLTISPEEAKKALNLPFGALTVGFFGKSQLLRGIDMLLDAFQRIGKAHLEAWLLLLLRPDVADRRVQKLIAQHPFRARIRLTLTTTDPRPYLAASDVIAFPFRTAVALPAQPLTLLEALALGKPVISTTIPPVQEIIQNGHEGLLVPPNRPDQLAERLLRLLKNPDEAARLGVQGRNRVLEEYSWDRTAERTYQLYRAALEGKP